ncbi:MAG: 6-phosphogluconolactonase [Pseudomonadota bacterium]
MLQEHFFSERSPMMEALRAALTLQLQQDLFVHERVSLFLSGGTTPAPLYQTLADAPLPWSRVAIAMVDERFVPVSDKASNEKLLRETMLRGHAAVAAFTGMSVASEEEKHEMPAIVQACNQNYARLPHPYSAAVLGMGADGHTASLFPHADGLSEAVKAEQHCVAIHAKPSSVTGTITERISMTPWALLQCRCLYLLFTGNEKKAVYEHAKTTSDPYSQPIAFFLQQQLVPVEVYWCP